MPFIMKKVQSVTPGKLTVCSNSLHDGFFKINKIILHPQILNCYTLIGHPFPVTSNFAGVYKILEFQLFLTPFTTLNLRIFHKKFI